MASATAQPNGNGKALVPPNATSQLSYSGTPRGPDGISYPDDYVDKLRNPITRMEIYEEMGNDDAVHTGIDARRQEICAANWSLSTASTDTNATEILEFCEDAIYPFLDDILRLLGGGALQYGFGAIEPVLQWSDRPTVSSISRGRTTRATRTGAGERIYIRKLAHIRQPGVWTFKIAGPKDPTGAMPGDLLTIRQYVFDGVSFDQRDIPAEKALLWVYNKQGDDHWGVPPTRHCYKAWTFKQQIEKLNLLHIDKFGVGTPVAEEGEGWQQADRDRLAAYLKAWRSGASNFILHPNGGSITIVGDNGKSTMSALEWVRYYNLAIAKTYLTQQTELGSTETGARALGEVFYSQLAGISQADCEAIANLANNALIVPLVRYNFGEQDTYPIFAPSQRVRAGSGVATVMQQLINSGAVHVRPEDEAYLRDVFELPPVELKQLQQEAKDRAAVATAAADAATAAKTGNPNDPNAPKPDISPKSDPEAISIQGDPANPPPSKIRPKPIAASAHAHRDHRPGFSLASTIADGAPEPATYGETSYRTPEYSQWEYGIVRPDVLGRELDMQVTRVASEATDVLRAVDEDLTRQVESLAAKGAAALSAGIKGIACPDRLRKQLRAVLLGAAQRARDYGAKAVMNEIERQLGPSAIGPQRTPAGYFSALFKKIRALAVADTKSIEDIKLEATVDQAVEEEIDRREQSARSAASNALHQAAGAVASVLASVASTGAKDALIGLSPGRTQDNVEGVVNTGFGIGRSETAQEIASGGGGSDGGGITDANGNTIGIVAKVYSAVMDMGTCDECAKWDGGEFPIDYPEDFTGVQAPNPRCAGGYARCRCVWVYLTSKESVPLVPASKGPQPIRRAA
jgi:hypothetical protein